MLAIPDQEIGMETISIVQFSRIKVPVDLT